MNGGISANFGFLAEHDGQLVRLGADAEWFFAQDPDFSLVRMRQLGEIITQHIAASFGLYTDVREGQMKLLRRLQDHGVVSPQYRPALP